MKTMKKTENGPRRVMARNDSAGKPQMNTDEHRFGGKMSFTIAQSASRKGDAPTPERQDRKIDDRNMPMNRFPIFLHQPSTLNHQPRPERDPLRFICVHLCPSVVSMPERCHSVSEPVSNAPNRSLALL